jgi:DNA-binding CsgD family transcriptional regulator
MTEMLTEIKKYLPGFSMPGNFNNSHEGRNASFYLASCTDNEFILVDESFYEVTGYPSSQILGQGLSWWFSVIHPEDVDSMLNLIFQHCFLLPVNKRLNKPFRLEYRVRSATGEWIWLHETKCVISVTQEGKNELILGRLVEISDIKKEDDYLLRKLMKEDGNTNPLLRAAMPVIASGNTKPRNLSGITMPTKREKEILHLIGEGYSTKQIADKLHISINTVETHRRHLLEKIQVKNSMELIKQTSNAHWLRAM